MPTASPHVSPLFAAPAEERATQVTGEHTAVLLRELRGAPGVVPGWSDAFVDDFRRRCSSLLGAPCFQGFRLALALGLLGGRDPTSALHARVFGGREEDAYYGRAKDPKRGKWSEETGSVP